MELLIVVIDLDDLEKLHEQVLYTQVRVKAKGEKGPVGGSGTVIYSRKNTKNNFSTYVLTCHHVIEGNLTVKKDYDPKIGRDRKIEYRQVAVVEFFDYLNVPHGHRPVSNSVDADIMAYDKTHDMALLKLRTIGKSPHVASFLPQRMLEDIKVGDKSFAVGCALLHDPILTEGMITHMGDEIDYKDYWMSSAMTIFGNSGGAVFTPKDEHYYFIGIPSRIDVVGWAQAVTHLGYFSPIHRVYKFLEEQVFDFIYDSNKTEEQCEKEREQIKLEAEKRMWVVEETE